MAKEKVVKQKVFTIKIGADFEKEQMELFNDPKKLRKPTNTLYLDTYDQLAKLFTVKKFELLQYLITESDNPQTVNQIAAKTKRKQEAISRDLHELDTFGLVHLKKNKNNVFAYPAMNTIRILFA